MLIHILRKTRPVSVLLALLLASAIVACGDDSTGGDNNNNTNTNVNSDAGVDDDGSTTGDADVQHDAMVDPPTAVLEIYALDIWAQPLPETEATLTVTNQSQPVDTTGHPVALVNLFDAGDYEVTLEAPDHETQEVTVAWDGGSTTDGATVTPAAGGVAHGFSVSHEMRDIYGTNLPVHSVYLGLRHKWFSAQGRPARRGNDIDLLMDGEDAWSSTYTDLTAATSSIMIATWWWESDFELVRDPTNHHLLTPTERYDNTILGILESSPAVHRVLIGEFWGSHDILDWLNTDSAMGTYAETANDDFEILGQANETMGVFQFEVAPFLYGDRVRETFPETTGRSFETETDIASTVPSRQVDLTWWPISVEIQLASYHQKFMVVDQEVAYIGGMNVKATDWDTSDHTVFEHRRMGFDATQADRQDVIDKDSESDTGPRKDYIIRLEGPAVQDAADVFQQRWAHQISEGALNAENATDFVVNRNQAEMPGGSQIQVTATLPQPFWEHAIAESWFNAVEQAQDFIFIEDQYWRIPMLTDVIIARMTQVPGLRLLVVTKPVSEWTDPGCSWTHETHQELLGLFPSRYAVYQLRSFDTVVTWGMNETEERYMDMDVHSKMLIVDDKFMSVGSCNKNNRGIVYEGELNVAVLDPVWVRDQRRRIFANMLPAGVTPTNDVATWWTQFSDAASWNDTVWENWDDMGGDINLGTIGDLDPLPAEYTPDGFVHGLIFNEVVDCLIEDVGPDMT
jgi:phosphatidylserine/phosphatidylglycerophosphate/cardiolipin synthase-like enzyme